MTTYALNKNKSETPPFSFRGDCCICATGKGSIRIMREMNSKWYPVTDDKGCILEYGADGDLAFNGHISCGVKVPHKVVATGEMLVTVRSEK